MATCSKDNCMGRVVGDVIEVEPVLAYWPNPEAKPKETHRDFWCERHEADVRGGVQYDHRDLGPDELRTL